MPAVLPNAAKSKIFRDRAEECRTLATLFKHRRTCALILEVAAEYERLADQAVMIELEE